MPELIGWASSIILLLTITRQIFTQWRERTSKGVSKWLFIGQVTASIGFSIYSILLHNWVFTVTNLLMTASAVVGLGMVMYHRRR